MRRFIVAPVFLGVSVASVAHAQDGAPPAAPPTGAASASATAAAPAPASPAPEAATGEEREANNALYVELLGPGLFYSLNYDRAFGDFAARVGVGYVSVSATDGTSSASASMLTVPISVSYLGLGSKKHMFELGGGITVINLGAGANGFYADSNSSASATGVIGHAILGYRMQPPDGGFFLRAGLSPLFSRYGFLPWPYVGLGATF